MKTPAPQHDSAERMPAGRLSPWEVGHLSRSPTGGWRSWLQLLGPGVLLAGASIGSGEWLAGPGISAQYGGALLWVATLSILGQVFCNIEMMRYALYCGEPVVVGFFRTPPGPKFWIFIYLGLDFGAIWPYNASNAAVPLAAALLGHLPGDNVLTLVGMSLTEKGLVKLLGYAIFLLAFLPLIFGGTIYKMLERVFAFKLVVVLAYLTFVAAFLVSGPAAREVCFGFFQFGQVPMRAETVIIGRHFNLTEHVGADRYTLRGTIEHGSPMVTEFALHQSGKSIVIKGTDVVPAELKPHRDRLLAKAESLAIPGRFQVTDVLDSATVGASGNIAQNRSWEPKKFWLEDGKGRREYAQLSDLPDPWQKHLRELIEYQGVRRVGIIGHVREHRKLPDLDWALLAAFASIAGAGGMTNTLFSNYAREKGWGMGAHVGAIPSAIGGKTIRLSHVGMAFHVDVESRQRWRGWIRHILRDQLAIWMFCSVIGMALPCMMSLEFIRNAPVSGERVAALTAEGIADRYPDFKSLAWFGTLFIAFLVLAPGQVMAGDSLSRRWTDILWTSSRRAHKLEGNEVKYVYYTILTVYALWGIVALAFFDPVQLLKIGGFIGNIALGFTSWHTLYVNRLLLPRELQPGWFLWLGTLACGLFFFGTSVIVFIGLLSG